MPLGTSHHVTKSDCCACDSGGPVVKPAAHQCHFHLASVSCTQVSVSQTNEIRPVRHSEPVL